MQTGDLDERLIDEFVEKRRMCLMSRSNTIIITCFAIGIILGVLFISYKNADTVVTFNIDDKTEETKVLGINYKKGRTINIFHNLKYSTSSFQSDRIISISESGKCHTQFEIKNGTVYDTWIDSGNIYVVYQRGKAFYRNRAEENVSLYTFNLKNSKILGDKILDKRFWGVDYIDNKAIYDQDNINIDNDLMSNIYCDRNKCLYIDGESLIEYSKFTGRGKKVLDVGQAYNTSIGRLNDLNVYCLVLSNDKEANDIKIMFINDSYQIISEKNIYLELKLCAFGENHIILVDENDEIIRLGEGLEKEFLSPFDLDKKDKIQDIKYNSEEKVFYIITSRRLLIMDDSFQNILSDNELTEKLNNFQIM